jgi:hypothetical protein
MMFFFKKKKFTLTCLTYDPMIVATAPILPALKFYPDWLKKMPSQRIEEKRNPGTGAVHNIPSGTLKGCPGVIDYFKTGFMAPLWTDASCIVEPDGKYSFISADNPFALESHWPGQWDGFRGYQHVKIILPWYLEEKTGLKFLLQKPYWTTNDDPLWINKLAPAGGVIDFNSQHCLHLHTFMELPQVRQEFIMKLGTPLIHLIPLTDSEVELKIDVIDEQTWIKKTQTSTGAKSFLKPSKTRDLFIKTLETDACPFRSVK